MGTKKRRRRPEPITASRESELTTAVNNLHATAAPSANLSTMRLHANQLMVNSFQRNIEDIERIIGMSTGNTGQCVPAGEDFELEDVEPVTRAWEEEFLHEAYGKQRACAAAGEDGGCWANKLLTNARASIERGPLSLVEFYTPSEYKLIEASGWKWPSERRLCLLCLRVATHRLFVQRRASNTTASPGVHYAKVSNLTGITGEYNLADCFVSAPDRFEGIVDPVVIPRLTDYDVCVVNGVRCVKQRHGTPCRHVNDGTGDRMSLDFQI
jgi:hypothetical protein